MLGPLQTTLNLFHSEGLNYPLARSLYSASFPLAG